MIPFATILAGMMLVGPTPKVDPPTPTPKVMAPKAKVTPGAVKGGDLLVIDASASTGEVDWEHDFPAGTFIIDGKKLYAALPARSENKQPFTVRLIYFAEKTKEKIVVTVPGADGPTPEPADGTLASLTVAVNALTKAVAAMGKELIVMKTDIESLKKPIPTPPEPTPTPTPNPTATKLVVLAFYDKALKDTPAIINDLDYWEGMKAKGHSWRKIDIKNPDAAAWQPYFTKGATPPSLVILDASGFKWLGTVPMPKDAAAMDQIMQKYTGAK